MKTEKLLSAIGSIDDELILGAQKNPRLKSSQIKWGSLAACLCVLLTTAFLWYAPTPTGLSPSTESPSSTAENQIIVTKTGVRIPPLKVEVPNGDASACMIAFFIYQNRCYVAYDSVASTPELMGSCLGTATGSLDAWSSMEEYVELSGSVAGDFYSVTGYDPAFLLCMKEEDGLRLYINDNGITLNAGSDLFEDRLHLKGRYEQVQYQTREDWYYGNGNLKTLGADASEALAAFVTALNEAPFMRIEDIPLPEGATSAYDDLEIYHMYFQMEDGISIHLRLFEGGYVQFAGIRGVCVQIPEECMKEMVGEF